MTITGRPPSDPHCRAEFYVSKARECREMAAICTSATVRVSFLRLAASYAKLAGQINEMTAARDGKQGRPLA